MGKVNPGNTCCTTSLLARQGEARQETGSPRPQKHSQLLSIADCQHFRRWRPCFQIRRKATGQMQGRRPRFLSKECQPGSQPAAPQTLRVTMGIWTLLGARCRVMGARCKGVRGTESGDIGQALAPAVGQVEGTSALGTALLFHSYRVFLDSRNSTWNLRAGTDGKLSKTSL